MRRQRYCTAFHPYAASTIAEAALEHPASNVQTYTRWLRTWRTVDTTPVRLELQIAGGTADVAGIFLGNANFESVLLSTSPDGVDWTDGATYALHLDDELDRRKLLIDVPVSTAFIGLTPGDLVSGAEYYELGAVALCQHLVEMGQGPERPGRTYLDPVTRLDYRGGGFETNDDGPLRVAVSMGGRWVLERAHADLAAIIRARKTTPILVDEGDDDSHVSIVQRTNDVSKERTFRTAEGVAFLFEECL